ncbi:MULTISPECIES: hypothetical protein [unclassified Haladaptatus]|uniref:hypothetical protein n=1 Tax=unclassified Haladaptatus TaxID=2622732 RepID=UPI0007B4EA43|nr:MULTISPECIES: hypothetical protein [unclassified Haladaptatus]KZN25007.1 hypothetical protein A4G99_00205 [Haladaptatus sp. R4]MCO8242458.1 hypothetical protein [Haladaptatus sp. AB643]MCO8252215.1 hypothetical protein [Haladaptatus sp. AB618]
MGGKRTEACGRCGLSTVIDATEDGEARDIYGDERIEVDEDEMRAVSRHVELLGRAKDRLNTYAERVTYGNFRGE